MSYVLRFMFRDLREFVRNQGRVSAGHVIVPEKEFCCLLNLRKEG